MLTDSVNFICISWKTVRRPALESIRATSDSSIISFRASSVIPVLEAVEPRISLYSSKCPLYDV